MLKAFTVTLAMNHSGLFTDCVCLLSMLFLGVALLILCKYRRQKKINRHLREQLQQQNDHIAGQDLLIQSMSQLAKISYFVSGADNQMLQDTHNRDLNLKIIDVYMTNMSPADREKFIENCRKLFSGEIKSFSQSCSFNIKGELRHHLNLAKIFKMPQTGHNQVMLLAMDITELERQNSELAKADSLLRAVFDNLPGHIFLKKVSSDFVYERCNPAFSGLLQKNPADISGKTDFDLFDRELAGRIRAVDLSIVRNHSIADNRWFFSTPDGKEHAIRFIDRILTLPDGTECILGFGVDVTHQEYIASKLRRRNKELRLLLTQISTRAMLLDGKLNAVCTTPQILSGQPQSLLLPENRNCCNICQCHVTDPEQCAARRLLSSGGTAVCSRVKSGEKLQLQALSDETGQINYIFAELQHSSAENIADNRAQDLDREKN